MSVQNFQDASPQQRELMAQASRWAQGLIAQSQNSGDRNKRYVSAMQRVFHVVKSNNEQGYLVSALECTIENGRFKPIHDFAWVTSDQRKAAIEAFEHSLAADERLASVQHPAPPSPIDSSMRKGGFH